MLLGGGYIAVEFAGIFAGLGSEVHVVMRQPLPLRGFDDDLRESLAEAMTQQGVRLHARCGGVRRVTADGGVKCVTLERRHRDRSRPRIRRHRPHAEHRNPRA